MQGCIFLLSSFLYSFFLKSDCGCVCAVLLPYNSLPAARINGLLLMPANVVLL